MNMLSSISPAEIEALATRLEQMAAYKETMALARDESHEVLPDQGQHARIAIKYRNEAADLRLAARLARAWVKQRAALRVIKTVPLLKIKQRLGMIREDSTEEERVYLEGGCLPLHEIMTEIDEMVNTALAAVESAEAGK